VPTIVNSPLQWWARRKSAFAHPTNSNWIASPRSQMTKAMNTSDFLAAALRNPVNEAIAGELFRLALPDAWIVAGCLVQTVWNVLTARPVDYGIDDYDIFYFDPDTSW
jgi:hypothetical protein